MSRQNVEIFSYISIHKRNGLPGSLTHSSGSRLSIWMPSLTRYW